MGLVWLGSAEAQANAVRPRGGGPFLQLDIAGGVYDTTTETTLSTAANFDVYAILNPGSPHFDGGYARDYFLAISVLPKAGPSDPGLGSFEVDGTTLTFSDLSHGGPEGLGGHDVFPTLWYELPFNFVDGQNIEAYNVEDQPTLDPVLNATGTFRYVKFNFDVNNLDLDYIIHFDLYNKKADGSVERFAPFSHDAEDPPIGRSPTGVPDAGRALALLAAGLCATRMMKFHFGK
jgi:hypothetical protein